MKRLIATVVLALALMGAVAACDPGPRTFCFGEGGKVDECVSTGSSGTLG